MLTYLPHELGECVKLKKLSLNHNRITGVQNILENMQELDELNLSQNKIEFISGLPESLTILNLSGNKIASFPETIKKCKLVYCNLKDNNI